MAAPLAAYIPEQLRPPQPPPSRDNTDTGIIDYEPARVYLAKWSHNLQVERSKEYVSSAESDHTAANTSHFDIRTPETSYSIIEDTDVAVVAADTIAKSGRLAMLKEYDNSNYSTKSRKSGGASSKAFRLGVWDETVLADSDIGSFVVLSTDTTPPPPKVSRLPPLSLAEWKLYFDEYAPVPNSLSKPDPDSLGNLNESMYYVPKDVEDEDSEFDATGKIVASFSEIQRRIFVGGVDPALRGQVWSTEYWRMKYAWIAVEERLLTEQQESAIESHQNEDSESVMYKDASSRVDKDVPRTDRNHPFYNDPIISKKPTAPGIDPFSPHQTQLRDILITYACSYPGSDSIGYVQGMSDLCSPFLIICDGDEVDAFWMFAHYMESKKQNFLFSGIGMRNHLATMERLIHATDPTLHKHLARLDALNVVLDTCTLWEVLETKMWGNGFEHFVALAIIDEHRDSILRYLFTFDEVLKYINDLANTIPVGSILEAAELLYLRFRVRAASLGILPVAETGDGISQTKPIFDLLKVLSLIEEKELEARKSVPQGPGVKKNY
ncbi:GTPase activating protein [Physocladia obscura]|uniref:GTPase activating protein n=1 Tax=Physocladia obscura TaxID=109957 RepID=A0AAD5SVA1_9FUNG|nr:GTPase activating protein [Physocladia obscura]